MAGVMKNFFASSMFMWILPIGILYGFNNNLFPGFMALSPHSLTLLSGFLAVISVNIVIVFCIYMAMKEPSDKHVPDAEFLAKAKDIVKQLTFETAVSDPTLKKEQRTYQLYTDTNEPYKGNVAENLVAFCCTFCSLAAGITPSAID